MTTIWISEFNWHRLRRAARGPVTWTKTVRHAKKMNGTSMVRIEVEDDVLARLAQLDPKPDTAINIMFDGEDDKPHNQ